MSAFYNVDQPPFNMSSKARAIAAANNGLLFDPSDLSTLYQDAAGTTPVTAVEQPVGKIIDKSGNGNHATQSITASRPTLSARYNLLTKTEDFSDAVWIKNGVSVTSSRYLSPIGTFTANKVTLESGTVTTGSDGVGAFASPLITANGAAYTLSLFAKSAGSNYIRFREAANTGQRVKINLIDGSFVGEEGWSPSTFTVTVTPAPNGFFLIQVTRSAPTTFCFSIKGGDDVGDGINGFYVWGADLRLGTTSGPYQRVNTSTDYDTNPAYFPKYLKFDGIDDYLNLPYMGLYANGSASVVAALIFDRSKLGNLLIEACSTIASSAYGLYQQGDGTLFAIARNNINVDSLSTSFGLSPFTYRTVVSFTDTGNSAAWFRNTNRLSNKSYTRSGVVTLNTLTLGAMNNSVGIVGHASFSLYSLIITKSALTDAQRIKCERYAASKAGVTL